MPKKNKESESLTNHKLLEGLNCQPSPINLHLYQPPRLLRLACSGKESSVFDITGTAPGFKGFNRQITRESYQPLINKGILADPNVSWDLYGVTADWLEVNYPDTINNLRLQMDLGADPPVGDPYLHIIFPFISSDHKDMLLEIGRTVYHQRWGIDPETIWLPESAVDNDTLSALVKNGFKAVHLREHQTKSQSAGNLYAITTPHGKILVISGNNHLSGKVGFDKPWADTFFKDWLSQAKHSGTVPRISIDGETLGHWWKEKEGAFEFTKYLLDYLDSGIQDERLNFSSPKVHDAHLQENTSWSCLDSGLGRWKGDQNCHCELPKSEHQASLVRLAKKDLFDKLTLASARIDEELDTVLPGWRTVYIDWFLRQRPSLARGSAISAEIIGDKNIEKLFLSAYIRDLGWTSCGWFFGDVGGFERQIPTNSLRAISEIMGWPEIKPNY